MQRRRNLYTIYIQNEVIPECIKLLSVARISSGLVANQNRDSISIVYY